MSVPHDGIDQVIFKAAEVLICVLDGRGKIVFFNRACEQCTGYDFEDLKGRSIWDVLIPDEERDEVRHVIANLNDHKSPRCQVNHWTTRDGRRRRIEWSNTVWTDPEGNPIGIIGTGIDITDRHQATLQAKQHMALLALAARVSALLARPMPLEARAQGVVDVLQKQFSAPWVSIWLYNDAHTAMQEIARAGNETQPESPFGSLRSEDLLAGIECLNSPRRFHDADQMSAFASADWIRRSGVECFVGYPLVTDDTPLGMVGLFAQTHLTQEECDVVGVIADQLSLAVLRHRSEKALHESEARFRATFEHAPVGIAHVATDGSFLRVNQKLCDIVGYSKEELLQRNYRDITHPQDIPIGEALARKLLEGATRSQSREKRYVHKDGSTVWVDLSVSIFRSVDGEAQHFITIVENASERKAAEEALRESEARLKAIFRVTPTGVGVVCKRTFLQANDHICEMTGYAMDELIGRNTRFLYPTEEDYRRVSAENRSQIAQRGTGTTDTRWKRKDGRVIDVLLSATPLDPADANGSVSITVMDITERKRSEEALRESEEKYRSVVERANDGIVIIQNNNLKYVNPRMAEMLGYEIEDVIGTPFAMYLWDENREVTVERYRQRLRGFAVPQVHESAVKHKSGQCIEVEINGGLISYEGAPADLVFLRDISERAEAQREMNQLRNLLQNTIDSMPSVLVCVNDAGRIIQWNEEATRLTAVPAIRALGRRIEEAFVFLQPEVGKVAEAIHECAVRTMSRVSWEIGGEAREFDVTIYPLRSGDVHGAVLRIDDVSERVKIEQMMVQTEKMVSVGGLAAGMAHEINNPLAGMVQNANVILNRMRPGYPANERIAKECGTSIDQISAYVERRKILPLLESMRASGEKAAKIIRNMLSFSRESTAAPRPRQITKLVDRALELARNDLDLRKSYGFKDFSILREYEDDLPLVCCHDTEIEQVLLNLFRNAAQALREREDRHAEPTITIRVSRETKGVQIEVADNGPGMSESVRRRVFEPFYTTKPPGVGTGLGLFVSYFIVVDHHGGTISVSSRPNKGATFALRLPSRE